jgi:hypothetical protein
VLKWNNVAETSIPSSAHLQSSPGIVQFLETSSDDDDDDDDGITCGLCQLLKSRNYDSASASPIATHDYHNNDDNTSSSSNHSTVGDGNGNNNYEDNDDNADDAKATMSMIPFPILHLVMTPPLLILVPFF